MVVNERNTQLACLPSAQTLTYTLCWQPEPVLRCASHLLRLNHVLQALSALSEIFACLSTVVDDHGCDLVSSTLVEVALWHSSSTHQADQQKKDTESDADPNRHHLV